MYMPLITFATFYPDTSMVQVIISWGRQPQSCESGFGQVGRCWNSSIRNRGDGRDGSLYLKAFAMPPTLVGHVRATCGRGRRAPFWPIPPHRASGSWDAAHSEAV